MNAPASAMASLRPPRVLFISHSASRNGATILLLSFLRWLRPRVDWDIEIVVNGSGPLLEAFRSIAPTTVWRDPSARLTTAFGASSAKFVRRAVRACARLSLPRGRFDLIYANTSAAASVIDMLPANAAPVLWHVHELGYALAATLERPEWIESFRRGARFVAVSSAVASQLSQRYGVELSKVDVVNGFIEPRHLVAEEIAALRTRMREKLGIAPAAFVVGGCGSLGWRKGTDLFLQVAKRLVEAHPGVPIRFVWVGGIEDRIRHAELLHDVAGLQLGAICLSVPTTADVLDHYAAMDVFAMTSREDPFPLVVLEACENGLPVVCFEEAGGTAELLATEPELRVPYLDVEAFSARLAQLMADRERARQLGRRLQEKIRQSHHADDQGQLLLQSIRRCLLTEPRHQPSAGHVTLPFTSDSKGL